MQHASHLERQHSPTQKHIQSEQLQDTVQKTEKIFNIYVMTCVNVQNNSLHPFHF